MYSVNYSLSLLNNYYIVLFVRNLNVEVWHKIKKL